MHKFVCGIAMVLILAILPSFIYSQVIVKVNSIPKNTSTEVEIYLAGNMNGWHPSDSTYRLTVGEDGTLSIQFDPKPGLLEFKFTQGDWSSVEVDKLGGDIANRQLEYAGIPITIELTIEGWKKAEPKVSTASKNVYILSDDFYIPQLNRNRRIWIYLPPDYSTSSKSYPVMYMHDGQNLFDDATSFSGEWKVDETLDALFHEGEEGMIIVGIENGGEARIEEYTPWPNTQYGGGKGDLYIDFIVQTLKPHIDTILRTIPDRTRTGIMGSSLGGLISFYAAIEHPETFGMAGVFSPSFWFTEDIYHLAEKFQKEYDTKLYFLGGEMESETMIEEMRTMISILKSKGFEDADLKMKVVSDGHHNESFWAREFGECYKWLTK